MEIQGIAERSRYTTRLLFRKVRVESRGLARPTFDDESKNWLVYDLSQRRTRNFANFLSKYFWSRVNIHFVRIVDEMDSRKMSLYCSAMKSIELSMCLTRCTCQKPSSTGARI